jgi:hypothetical protein
VNAPSPEGPGGERNATFNAHDNAKIGGQFAHMYGDVHIYDVGPSATPEERFTTALNLLDGAMPRRAEQLIQEAVEGGYQSHKVAYYWALAILSGRSFDHLDNPEFESLRHASALVDPDSPDEWVEALNVITRFVNCLLQQERAGVMNDQDYELSIRLHDALPEDRREELRRHLEFIMTGALQDRLAATDAAKVKEYRMAGDRKNRVGKFFTPDPQPPIPRKLVEPQITAGTRAKAVIGASIAGSALLIAFLVIIPVAPLTALLYAAGLSGGGYLLATKRVDWLVARGRIAADNARHGQHPMIPTAYAPAAPPEEHEDDDHDDHEWGESDRADDEHRRVLLRRAAFRAVVAPFVDICFRLENPDGANKRRDWWTATQGLREELSADLRRRYTESDVTINELDWLTTWHAKRAKERWEKGTLREHRERLRAEAPGGSAGLGLFVLGFGLLCGVIGLFRADIGFGLLLILLAGVGAMIGLGSGFHVQFVKQKIHQAEAAWTAAEEAEEQAAFRASEAKLADRPTDAEMARWLDYDKFYIKNLAMNTCGLANRDIVAHAVLTEYKAPCMKARVVFGPPRYSRYRVVVFLLTETGVRQISVGLDFLTGAVSNQQRNNFRYDAIASARVVEVGLRFDAGRRSVILMDETEEAKKSKDLDSLISSQAFRLSLMGGPPIDIVVEHFDEGFLDRLRENLDSLFELALDSSGVRGALRVLESVAAEGREWLSQERNRRTRRLLDFKREITARRELPWDPGDDDDGSGVPALTGG